MNFETPDGSNEINSDFTVRGWALNPSGVREVNIIIDGNKIGTTKTGNSRKDVLNVFPAYNDSNSGFLYNVSIDGISDGQHKITVGVIGNDGTVTYMSKTVTVKKPTPESINFGNTKPSIKVGGYDINDIIMINGRPYANMKQLLDYLFDVVGTDSSTINYFETVWNTGSSGVNFYRVYVMNPGNGNTVTKIYYPTDKVLFDGNSGNPYCDILQIICDLGLKNKIQMNYSSQSSSYSIYVDVKQSYLKVVNNISDFLAKHEQDIAALNFALMVLAPEMEIAVGMFTLYSKGIKTMDAIQSVAKSSGKKVVDVIESVEKAMPSVEKLTQAISSLKNAIKSSTSNLNKLILKVYSRNHGVVEVECANVGRIKINESRILEGTDQISVDRYNKFIDSKLADGAAEAVETIMTKAKSIGITSEAELSRISSNISEAIGKGSKFTKPTLREGGVPRGVYESATGDADTIRSITRQNEAADLLAKEGYDIEMLPYKVDGNGEGLIPTANPDYKIMNNVFDCYSPSTSNVRNIWSTVQEKTLSQGRRIVLNLNDYTGSMDGLVKQFYDWPIESLDELIVIKDGKIVTLFIR